MTMPPDDTPYLADTRDSVSGTDGSRRATLASMLAKSTGSRVLSLISQGVCAILATRLIIGNLGLADFGYVILIAGLPAVLSFMDFGVGAAVTNVVAGADGSDATKQYPVINTALKTLIAGSVSLIIFSIVCLRFDLWSRILNIPSTTGLDANLSVSIVLILFALTLPLNVGGSLMIGAGRNSQLITLRMIQPPVTVILLWLMLKSGTNINLLPASWQIGNLAAAIAVALVAERSLNLRILMSVGDILLFRPLPGGQIRKTAAPMFVVMVGLPIALQSDRIILSNQTNLTEVANYSVVATLQGPLLALTAATGTALWPHFTRRRDTPGVRSDFIQALVAFVVAGLFAALGLVIFGPLLTPVVSKDQASVGLFVFFAAAMVIAIQSAHTPAGMFLTDEEGLRFQAKTVTAMALANLLLSWVLADKYGAAGPYLGTAISIGVCQLGPTLWVAFKRLQVEPSMPPAAE